MQSHLLLLRRASVIAVHLALAGCANVAAFALRFEGDLPLWAERAQWQMLPWLVLLRGLIFAPFGLYRASWRFAGIWDLRNILVSIGLSSLAFVLLMAALPNAPRYPRSVYLIDALLLAFVVGGMRFVVRLRRRSRARSTASASRRVLVFGAGDAGESIVREMQARELGYSPIGFVDDDRSKVGQSIHGVPVQGTRQDLRQIMAATDPDEVLIAMPAAEPATVRGVVRALEPFKVHITILPNLRDLLDGTVAVSMIRRLAIEDLLPRAAVGLDQAPLRHLLAGRRVLVTGAGGSIGSELCQQIAALHPETLVLYERNENGLYTITNALADHGVSAGVQPVLGDITDVARLEDVMARFRPEIVFHAAAHKHVPLMESHPCEAVKNNVGGTRILVEASKRHGVARFIMISTDKAVNPTSVMGATKRVAELIVMNACQDGLPACLTVRFGNVLGSNGSAIPRFIEQIRSGGPVTITHPEMRRYFMLLPEAAQLVLHVAGRGESGGVYVLDMGEQIKVVEMARNLIRLSGYVPDEDIQLSYIGLRPGEKLYEELVGANETVRASSIEKVFEVTSQDLPGSVWLNAQVRMLERFARQGNSTAVMRSLMMIVPEFTGRPWGPVAVEPAPLDVEQAALDGQAIPSAATT